MGAPGKDSIPRAWWDMLGTREKTASLGRAWWDMLGTRKKTASLKLGGACGIPGRRWHPWGLVGQKVI